MRNGRWDQAAARFDALTQAMSSVDSGILLEEATALLDDWLVE